MNIFRFIADMLHLSAILILLYRIKNNRNCIGKYSEYPSWFSLRDKVNLIINHLIP